MRLVDSMIATGFTIVMGVCNLHLFSAGSAATLSFQITAVTNGEWWRIITHPFVHVSWYHLALDTAAVIVLWREIDHPSAAAKLFAACACAAGSLTAAARFSPLIGTYGLCGLSGTAHGLMFLLGLHWIITSRESARQGRSVRFAAGLIMASGVALKSLLEVTTGSVVFASIHAGDLGIPIVESHLGGIIGGLIGCALLSARTRRSSPLGKA